MPSSWGKAFSQKTELPTIRTTTNLGIRSNGAKGVVTALGAVFHGLNVTFDFGDVFVLGTQIKSSAV
jgi:hypothetical protein